MDMSNIYLVDNYWNNNRTWNGFVNQEDAKHVYNMVCNVVRNALAWNPNMKMAALQDLVEITTNGFLASYTLGLMQ